ncbi:hypothetical protein Poli38472_003826 [Pythium oligandrum]|uniref:Ribosomal protein mS38 C-terminal domain-containing protein n=1 Tax=Pythium oligandrum TaxID=41045 RepID=A0A8K1FKH4_PYTOL|nr:hypothetical protein Poli38472_003826 [Pythium oligandrum]|eukprot:TMW66061.1 hypothetical protein Poli38472_003826 [Pythium oligandrum]
MALRAVSCGLRMRATAAMRPTLVRVERRAFMSTNEIFSEPSFPLPATTLDSKDLLDKYPKLDVAEMWKVGSFPVQENMRPMHEEQVEDSVLAAEELWDTSGMLSALSDALPLRDGASRGVDEMLREMEQTHGYFADSVLKKRRKKMNKHKHRKRKKALRMRTKKN